MSLLTAETLDFRNLTPVAPQLVSASRTSSSLKGLMIAVISFIQTYSCTTKCMMIVAIVQQNHWVASADLVIIHGFAASHDLNHGQGARK